MVAEAGSPGGEIVYRTEEEFSEFGVLPAEEAMRKGQEIKASLKAILEDVERSGLVGEDIRVDITVIENIQLLIVPRQLIKLRDETGRVQATKEPTLLQHISASIQFTSHEQLRLLMVGGLVQAPDLQAELDPLAGHEILAFEQGLSPGVRHEGGIRVSTGSDGQVSTLKFELR